MTTKEAATKSAPRTEFHEVTWQSIAAPGAYVDRSTGDLFRFTQEAVGAGDSPIVRKESLSPARLVRLSKDPFITTAEARMLAASCDVSPNF